MNGGDWQGDAEGSIIGQKVVKYSSHHWCSVTNEVTGQDREAVEADIGQDISVTIPDGALTATVNIPDTINVTGVVDVGTLPQSGVGTVIGGNFGGDDESVQVRLDSGGVVSKTQSVPANIYIGTRVARKGDGTFIMLQ